MGIFIGTSTENQKEISIGASQIGEVYVGSDLVWKKGGGEIVYDPPAWLYYEGQTGLDIYGMDLLPYGKFTGNGNYPETGTVSYSGGIDTSTNDATALVVRNATDNLAGLSIFTSESNRPTSTGYPVRAVRNIVPEDGGYVLGKSIANAYTDIDGTTYDGVMLVNRVWTKPPIRTTRFSDGTPIPEDNSTFITRLEAKRHYRSFPSGYSVMYYNGMGITGNRGLKTLVSSGTLGWRVPTRADIQSLINSSFTQGKAYNMKSIRINQE